MPATATPPDDPADTPSSRVSSKTATLVAVVAGLLSIVLAVLTPLLPVKGAEPDFTWPTGQQLIGDNSSVTAPLIAQTPAGLNVTVPCSVLAALPPEGATLLSTLPSSAPRAQSRGLFVTATADRVNVNFRNNLAATALRSELANCSELRIWSEAAGPGAHFVGLGEPTILPPDARPMVAGIFSSLTAAQATEAATNGLSAQVEVDNRYDSSPTILKLIVMILAAISLIVALVALYLLDRIHGYHRRFGRLGWRRILESFKLRLTDAVVTVVLVVWNLLGAGTADDGYILNMGRTADDFGYLANYYRFYGIAEAPFDWYYSFLSVWAKVSPSLLWMHIPSLIAGLVSWFVLSRILLPRLGPAIRRSGWAYWAAATVFLAFWLPYCSGLRSESIIVLGSLLTWWAAERAIATRRMLPAAMGALAAAATLALAPQGVVAIAVLLVAARPMLRIILARRHETSLVALLAPIFAAGLIMLVVVFRDQTAATVAEAMKLRYQIGPTAFWHQEFLRYYFISVTTDDGALARRVPVLLLLAGAFVTIAVLLRRSRITGVDPAPSWRLVGAIGVTLVLFIFTPTKWTIHFGVLAGLGAAVAATATLAVAQSAARSARNLTVFVSGLLFALAAAMAGKNAWPYAYEFGISWFDRAPVIAGINISSLFLVLAVIAAAIAVWQHLRMDYVKNKGLAHHSPGRADSAADRRRLSLASSPIALIAALLVLSELAVFARAAAVRDGMTVFSTNIDALSGQSCAMADAVLAEPDANVGMLVPAGGESVTEALTGTDSAGFTIDGIPDVLGPKPGSARPGQMNVAGSTGRPFVVDGDLGAGTTGGLGPVGVNGSNAALPFGLNPATTPVLGSKDYLGEARLVTAPYELPARDASPLLVVSAAGAISTVDAQGVRTFGQRFVFQFGRPGPDGEFEQLGPDVVPIDPGSPVIPNMPWRNLRVPMSSVPAEATQVRLSLLDNNLGADQFMVVTPPRAPRLVTLQELVGSEDPALIDFVNAAQFPCQRPMTVRYGVAEIPQWRIRPDYVSGASQSKTWMSASGGGLLAISETTTRASTVPTYLDRDWHQDWGALERLTPRVPDAPAAELHIEEETRWGWTREGSIRVESANG